MRWEKLGIIYKPDGFADWANSHAMIPTPVIIDKETVRVYTTFCDKNGIGRPGYVDLDSSNLKNIKKVSSKPLLEIGLPGSFDDNGILTCSVVDLGDGVFYMYYAGFELCNRIRYRLLTGLAVSQDGGETFARYSNTPILERSSNEMYFRGGPFCKKKGDLFKMWYVAGGRWTEVSGKSMPEYDIRYLESTNGVDWSMEGQVHIPVTKPDEHGFGRPYVISKTDGSFQLFYSIRKKSLRSYRLGYAESADGVSWNRLDNKLNLDVSESGFDSEAIMYAAPIEINDETFVFYNGNEFGKDGFALAKLIS